MELSVVEKVMSAHKDWVVSYRLTGDSAVLLKIVDACNALDQGLSAENMIANFLKDLTIKERDALTRLLDYTQRQSCYFSMVKLIQATPGISKTVFENLSKKLVLHKLAQIENHGVKGTRIDWLIEDFGAL